MAVMEYIKHKKMIENVKNGVLRKFPLLGVTMSRLQFEPSKSMSTACTDGEKIVYSPEFLESLPFDDRVFIISHEVMHNAFDHLLRSKDKDMNAWNVATDAVINQMLQSANLPIPKGAINMPDAIDKSAEEMYNILLERAQQLQNSKGGSNGQNSMGDKNNSSQNEQNKGEQDKSDNKNKNGQCDTYNHDEMQENERNQGQDGENSTDDNSDSNDDEKQDESGENEQDKQNNPKQGDNVGKVTNHDMWGDAVKRAESKEQNKSDEHDEETQPQGDNEDIDDFEKAFIKNNEQLKEEIGRHVREKMRDKKDKICASDRSGYTSKFNGVGESRSAISWKKILKRELEKEEDRWSYRRADEDNDYQARIGSFDVDDYPETEVMLDVSGSVDDEFLKGFLRQLKPLLKESKLRVGCFDEFVYRFAEIKSMQDIDTFAITRTSVWTENWDGAVRAFSKKRGVNKIVFTDGIPCPGTMPKRDLKNERVYWIVFENKDFKPCCGKVIFVDKSELKAHNKREEINLID